MRMRKTNDGAKGTKRSANRGWGEKLAQAKAVVGEGSISVCMLEFTFRSVFVHGRFIQRMVVCRPCVHCGGGLITPGGCAQHPVLHQKEKGFALLMLVALWLLCLAPLPLLSCRIFICCYCGDACGVRLHVYVVFMERVHDNRSNMSVLLFFRVKRRGGGKGMKPPTQNRTKCSAG